MGKFERNSLVGKIVILSRELNQIWGSAVYLDLVFRSCTGSIGVSFFFNFSIVKVCQCNMGKFEGNSLV